MTENSEIKPVEMNADNPKKKIIKWSLFSEVPIICDENKVDKYPVKVCFSDGEEDTIFVYFDKYFRLNNTIWNQPDFAEDAGIITMEDKMKDAAPYNLFFNKLDLPSDLPDSEEDLHSISFTGLSHEMFARLTVTSKIDITTEVNKGVGNVRNRNTVAIFFDHTLQFALLQFLDLLCPSLGKLKCSLLISFPALIQWILMQFALRKLHKLPMTILHGDYTHLFPWPEKQTMEELYPNIDYHCVQVKVKETDLGCHHSNLNIFVYEDDSLRVVIGSADLHFKDWDLYNQQIWVSPLCPRLPEGSSVMNGESPTGFKFALLDYLFTYEKYNISSMQEWIKRIENADFSDIKVALVFSAPGFHFPRKNGSILHFLGHLLTRDCTIPAPKAEHDSWRIIAHTTSLGLLGHNAEQWLTTHVLKALDSHKDLPYLPTLRSNSKTKFSLIYPTVQNVLNGHRGVAGAGCTYEKAVKDAQPWLLKYQCKWKADRTKRTHVMPHTKSYSRISPCWQKMAYYYLSTANLSRSSWGKIPTRESGIYVRSYEIGVLFLPKYFEEEYFEVMDIPNRKNKKVFPIIFDLPLTPYGPIDDSFCGEEIAEQEDQPSFDSIQKKNDPQNSLVDRELKKSDDCLVSPAGSADSKNETNESIPETKKKDMKFNIRPKTDMFFPSFNKKS